ncbi:hypothetical protein [Acetobacter sp. LMG 32666]|uniref:hypothetical protein n=1 Tax=Acetobacter sp. LMG 32666 TaxID=2959295 RepID=UPI0030C7AFD0
MSKKANMIVRVMKTNIFNPYLSACLLAIISIVIFFPGFMSYDSFSQYGQALGREPLTDFHPPGMSYLWRSMCLIVKSPGTLLIFDQFVYWGGIAIFAYAVAIRTWVQILLVLIIGFWPPLYIISLHLWADVGMMSFLALTVACLAAHCKDKKKIWLFIATGSLFVVMAFRYNGITGVLPLLAYTAWCFSGYSSARIQSTVKTFFALALAFILGIRIISIGTQHVSALNVPMVWDLSAISVAENKDLFPDYLNKTPGPNFMGRVREHWNPNVVELFDVSPFVAREKEQDFHKYWATTVLHNFRPYMAHRMHVAWSLLGLTHSIHDPYHKAGIDKPNMFELDFANPEVVRHRMMPLFQKVSSWPVYRVWLYFLLAFIIIFQYLRKQRLSFVSGRFGPLPAITALSGVMVELPLFIAAPSTEFRYSIWMVFSVLLAVVMLVSERISLQGLPLKPLFVSPKNGENTSHNM